MGTRNITGEEFEYWMLIVRIRLSFLLKGQVIFLLMCLSLNLEVKGQDSYEEEKNEGSFAYDGIPVLVIVEGYTRFYVDAVYANNDLLYVNIEDLFKSLNITSVSSQNSDILSGFIENENQKYTVDYNNRQIKVGEKTVNIQNGLIKEKGVFYLESSLFAEAFGILLTFNYRALTIILKSNFELPIIKQQRIEKLRENISKIKGEEIVDTVLHRNYHLFKFGTLDWSAASTQTWGETTYNHFGLGVGTELLYGEADVAVNYYDQYKFDNRQLNYLWRWVDNDKKLIKQAQVGRISNQTVAFINSPIDGITIRNSPTTVRKATGYYTINEFTEPNWTVELYINNVMVDYTKADASGLFIFKVPIVYGYTTLKLKFYGPLGEERSEERTINMPYTVMPTNEFEYGLSAGILEDSTSSRFGRGEFNYGVNRILTVGGGLEYLSSIPNGAFIPFAKATVQPFSRLTLNGEYAYGVKSRGLLDYYFMKDALFEVDYTKYTAGQLATQFNADEERKVKLSIPFRYKKIIGFSKFDFTQNVYKAFNYNQGNIIVSAFYKQFSANSSTQINWVDQKTAYTTSELALSYRLKNGFNLRPSAIYSVSDSKFMSCKFAVEKSIPRGFFSISYERNILFNDNYINFSFRYDFSFARTNISLSHSNGKIYTNESAQGSFAFGSGNKTVHVSNNASVGKGGISVYPFLDLNQNGVFDKGEHMVNLSTVRVVGSKAIYNEKDSIVRIPDLIPFTKYILEFNDNDLDNISWRFKYKTYQVLVDPNQFKRIDIPVVSVGEISGMVYMNQDNTLNGLGRITVKLIKRNNTKWGAETLSESDGYIDYMGLEPGEYVAYIDSTQLSNLDYTVEPKQIEFTIKALEEGDVVNGLNFVLKSNVKTEVARTDSLPHINVEQIINQENRDTLSVFNSFLIIGSSKDSLLQRSGKTDERIIKLNSLIDENNQTLISGNNSEKDSLEIIISKLQTRMTIQTLVWGELCDTYGNYYIQCGAFKYESNAKRLALYIQQYTNLRVGIALHNGLYKVRVECVSLKMNAEQIKAKLKTKSVGDDMFIVKRK